MKAAKKQDKMTKLANSLTAEQYSRLLNIAMPLTDEEKNVSVDDLYAELLEPMKCDWCGDEFKTDSYDLNDGRVFDSEMCRAQGEAGRRM